MADNKEKDGPKVVDARTLDPNEFRVAATDNKGHTVRVFFRAQPGHAHELEVIKASKKFPYRTKGDILRHAFVRHLRWLHNLAPIPSVLAEVDAILEIAREEEFAADFQLVFEKAGDVVARHLGRGSIGEARRFVLKVMEHIDRMPPGYWRDRYKKEAQEKWGGILAAAPKPSLASFVGGD